MGATAVYPGKRWEITSPEAVGLSRRTLAALTESVGGRGCVVRRGYRVHAWGDQSRSADIASAVKPLLSTLLLFAVQEGRLRSVDDPVVAVEPRLRSLNDGKDAAITWRHLACQTSGYGLAESPGAAYAYNDYALALYYDTLMDRVFRDDGTQVLKTRLADPLMWEDPYTFTAFGPDDRPGRLAASVRDFARFGLFWLREGLWRGERRLRADLMRRALTEPVPVDTPLASGGEAAMLPGQRTLGGGKRITPLGPGWYSFNWWINGRNRAGERYLPDLPPDTYVANGHGGRRMLWVVPRFDLIVCWNDAVADLENAPSRGRISRLIRDLVRA